MADWTKQRAFSSQENSFTNFDSLKSQQLSIDILTNYCKIPDLPQWADRYLEEPHTNTVPTAFRWGFLLPAIYQNQLAQPREECLSN
jgi:hypothetical protein